jgi:Glycine rich protein
MECDSRGRAIVGHAKRRKRNKSGFRTAGQAGLGLRSSASVSRGDRRMLRLRRRFQPALTRFVASAALAWMGSVALAGASQAAAVTFNYTGSDVSYTISPGAYRITVYGAQGGDACTPACSGSGGRGAEASAIYQIGQTLDLRIGVGGAAPPNGGAAGGGGASFVDFLVGDPGLDILLLVGGGGGGGSQDNGSGATGGTV